MELLLAGSTSVVMRPIDFGRQVGIDHYRQLRLPQHVDEAWRNHHTARIDAAACGCAREIADGRDLSRRQCRRPRSTKRISRAVDNVSVENDDVVRVDGGGKEVEAEKVAGIRVIIAGWRLVI